MILTTNNVEVRYKPRHFESIREVPPSLIKKGVRVIVGTTFFCYLNLDQKIRMFGL